MKIIKSATVILLSVLILCGCSSYGEKRIVKLITIDRDSVKLHYYDYSKDDPSFLVEEKHNSGVENTLVELLSEAEYDLKLCQYAVCSSDMVKNSTAEIYSALINTKFSPDITIIVGDTADKAETYTKMKTGDYPLYTYKEDYKGITGVVENYDKKEKEIIISSRYYKTLDDRSSFVFDVLSGNIKNGVYAFERNGENISVTLENIMVFHSAEKDMLKINITARLKSYKGLPADEINKSKAALYAQADIAATARALTDDAYLAENLNLLWYGKTANFDGVKINVKII